MHLRTRIASALALGVLALGGVAALATPASAQSSQQGNAHVSASSFYNAMSCCPHFEVNASGFGYYANNSDVYEVFVSIGWWQFGTSGPIVETTQSWEGAVLGGGFTPTVHASTWEPISGFFCGEHMAQTAVLDVTTNTWTGWTPWTNSC